MGFEYKIAFRLGDRTELNEFLNGLRAGLIEDSTRADFTVAIEDDGFYFCDHTKSNTSSCAFRRLIDEALSHSKVVVHEL